MSKLFSTKEKAAFAAHTSNAANLAVRGFLKMASRKFESTKYLKEAKDKTLNTFQNCCAYCGESLANKKLNWDHIVPHNKTSMGLHVIGNLAPTCQSCNAQKQDGDWQSFLTQRAPANHFSKLHERLKNHIEVAKVRTLDPKYANELEALYHRVQTLVDQEIHTLLKQL